MEYYSKVFKNTHLTIQDTSETANTILLAKPAEKFQSYLPATTCEIERESIVNIPSREKKTPVIPPDNNEAVQLPKKTKPKNSATIPYIEKDVWQ